MGFFKALGEFLGGPSGVSSLLGAGSAIFQATQQRKAAKENAKRARQQAAEQAAAKQREVQRLVGSQRAAFAASGVQIDDDTPGLVIRETRALGQQDVNRILAYGEAQARSYKRQGRNALIGGALSAGSGLLGGFADNRLMVEKYGKSVHSWSFPGGEN
ncbi:hypothetical protein [Kiloniella sp. b19]|uniref:hypothetical protein n=1 Tax=Kiloniella sp. GXU_MW_B19 TaxID=3141326 RepID=UPI0031D893E4